MVSAAEQLASNINFSAFSKAKELKSRILFTIVSLLVYRIGTYIPLPGINLNELEKIFNHTKLGIIGVVNMFAGGAIERMAIFALGIMPYISASIVIQLIIAIVPSLEYIKKENDYYHQQKLNQYTRYLAIILSALQAYGLSIGLENAPHVVMHSGWLFRTSTVITLMGGTMFLVWLGEEITSKGIGNGISLIIFSGIICGIPSSIISTLELGKQSILDTWVILLIVILFITVITIVVFVERSQRRLFIHYPKRQISIKKMIQSSSSFLPLKINTAGVIPPIFSSSLLLLPITISNFSIIKHYKYKWLITITSLLSHGKPLFMILYSIMIIFFCFFYTSITFNVNDTANNLKKNNGFIPGIRPGIKTAEHIQYVLTRITVLGSLYITCVCLLPEFIVAITNFPFYFGGTSLLIIVTVTIETVMQIQGYLLSYQYNSLIKKSKFKKKRK